MDSARYSPFETEMEPNAISVELSNVFGGVRFLGSKAAIDSLEKNPHFDATVELANYFEIDDVLINEHHIPQSHEWRTRIVKFQMDSRFEYPFQLCQAVLPIGFEFANRGTNLSRQHYEMSVFTPVFMRYCGIEPSLEFLYKMRRRVASCIELELEENRDARIDPETWEYAHNIRLPSDPELCRDRTCVDETVEIEDCVLQEALEAFGRSKVDHFNGENLDDSIANCKANQAFLKRYRRAIKENRVLKLGPSWC